MADSNPIIKICIKCNQVLSLNSFRKDRREKDHLSSYCRPCASAANRESYLRHHDTNLEKKRNNYKRNRETVLAENKRYRDANPEKVKLRAHSKYLANREHIKAKSRAWYANNKERAAKSKRVYADTHRDFLNALSRKYAREKPETRRAHSKNNKMKRRKAPGYCSRTQWLAKVEYHGWCCIYCKTPLTSTTMHMEHRKPLTRGGSHWPANLAPSCIRCNLSKNDKTETEFRAVLIKLPFRA